jgi:hypothetical protein
MERESIKAITERVRKERVQGIVNGGTDGAIIEVEPKISQSEIIQPEVAILEPVNHSAAFLTDRQDLTTLTADNFRKGIGANQDVNQV